MSRRTLGRADVLAIQDLPVELIDVPEWPDYDVYVRGLTGVQRAEYFAALVEVGPDGKARAKAGDNNKLLAFFGLCDESGEPLFTDRADVDLLGHKNAAAIDRVARAVQRLSGLGVNAAEEAQGNSEPTPSDEPSLD
jgi:hypothetical protein